MQVLMKWGEYSNDVHLILQRTALDPSNGSGGVMTRSRTLTDTPLHSALNGGFNGGLNGSFNGSFNGSGGGGGSTGGGGGGVGESPSTLLNKELKKSLTFSGHSPLQLVNNIRLNRPFPPPPSAGPSWRVVIEG